MTTLFVFPDSRAESVQANNDHGSPSWSFWSDICDSGSFCDANRPGPRSNIGGSLCNAGGISNSPSWHDFPAAIYYLLGCPGIQREFVLSQMSAAAVLCHEILLGVANTKITYRLPFPLSLARPPSQMSRNEDYLDLPEPSQPESILEGFALFENCRAVWALSDPTTAADTTLPPHHIKKGGDQSPPVHSPSEPVSTPASEIVPTFDPLGVLDHDDEGGTTIDLCEGERVTPEIQDRFQYRLESGVSDVEAEKASGIRSDFALEIPSLRVEPGLLVAVVGRVGAGKSMLIETLCGGGPTVVRGRVAKGKESVGLVPQEALVVSGTVEENITMGRSLNESRFAWAVRTACMER